MNATTHAQEETLRVRFARKAVDLDEVLREAPADQVGATVVVTGIREMSAAEYDEFAHHLLADRNWLRGQGGAADVSRRRVVAVSAPNRRTLYVDPSGYDYARYVGLRID